MPDDHSTFGDIQRLWAERKHTIAIRSDRHNHRGR